MDRFYALEGTWELSSVCSGEPAAEVTTTATLVPNSAGQTIDTSCRLVHATLGVEVATFELRGVTVALPTAQVPVEIGMVGWNVTGQHQYAPIAPWTETALGLQLTGSEGTRTLAIDLKRTETLEGGGQAEVYEGCVFENEDWTPIPGD